MEKSNIVILDNGSGYLKCGFSNLNVPSHNIPALIGRPMLRFAEHIEDFEIKPIMIGDEIIPVRSLLEISHPMEEGMIKNTEEMAMLWDYALSSKVK